MKSKYHDIRVEIENCKTERDLLRIVEDVVKNSKKYHLDEVDLQRLEDVGMKKYERFQRDRMFMIKNKKQGFNNFD